MQKRIKNVFIVGLMLSLIYFGLLHNYTEILEDKTCQNGRVTVLYRARGIFMKIIGSGTIRLSITSDHGEKYSIDYNESLDTLLDAEIKLSTSATGVSVRDTESGIRFSIERATDN